MSHREACPPHFLDKESVYAILINLPVQIPWHLRHSLSHPKLPAVHHTCCHLYSSRAAPQHTTAHPTPDRLAYPTRDGRPNASQLLAPELPEHTAIPVQSWHRHQDDIRSGQHHHPVPARPAHPCPDHAVEG